LSDLEELIEISVMRYASAVQGELAVERLARWDESVVVSAKRNLVNLVQFLKWLNDLEDLKQMYIFLFNSSFCS
jgi:hypothetical protein